MKKDDLVEILSKTGEFSRKEALDLINSAFGVMKETLASGQDLMISGFGKFTVRKKKDRWGRNPQTGEPIVLMGRKAVTFKLSTVFKEMLNKGRHFNN